MVNLRLKRAVELCLSTESEFSDACLAGLSWRELHELNEDFEDAVIELKKALTTATGGAKHSPYRGSKLTYVELIAVARRVAGMPE